MTYLNLLIVDDEPAARTGLSQLLEWNTLNINLIGTAKDGNDAYNIIKEKHPDIVIVDINMPNCTGLELIELTIAAGLSINYIILSGYDDFSYAQKAISLNVFSYLLKPVKKERLLEEINKLIHHLNKIENQSNITSRAVNKGKKALKSQFFNTLMDYSLRDENELMSNHADLNIKVPLDNLRVFSYLYKFDSTRGISGFSEDDQRLFRFSLKNIIFEIFEEYALECIEKDPKIISFIISSTQCDIDELEKLCRESIECIYRFGKVSIVVGISKPISHIRELGLAYQSSIESLSYRIYSKSKQVYTPNNFSTASQAMQVTTIDTSDIYDAIIRVDFDLIKITIIDFLAKLFYTETPPPQYLKGMCVYLIIDIQKKLSQYDLCIDLSMEHQSYITNADSFEEIQNYIIQLFCTYSLELKDNNLLINDSVIEEVKSYLQKNLHQKVLLSDIAEKIHISESYLAAYFKKKTGESFREYVINVKMEIAKTALQTTNKSISEISQELGYSDYRSFNRVFKKSTGQTPSDYYALYHRGKKDAI